MSLDNMVINLTLSVLGFINRFGWLVKEKYRCIHSLPIMQTMSLIILNMPIFKNVYALADDFWLNNVEACIEERSKIEQKAHALGHHNPSREDTLTERPIDERVCSYLLWSC